MVRARKSHRSSKEKVSQDLPGAPYSSTVDGHRYVIYVWKGLVKIPKRLVLKFLSDHAAHYFIRALVKDDEFKFKRWFDRDDMIMTSSEIGIRAHADQVKRLWNYVPTVEEEGRIYPEIDKSVANFKGVGTLAPSPRSPVFISGAYVSAIELSSELGIQPGELRAFLRSSKAVKPQGGWKWSREDADAVKEKYREKRR